MEIKLMNALIYHKRFTPKVNEFSYRAFYIRMPLDKIKKKLSSWYLGINQWGLFSFLNKDHGHRDSSDLRNWHEQILTARGHRLPYKTYVLAIPRLWGYLFNPVSFWVGLDSNNDITSILCEVNNTYRESHNYLCIDDGKALDPNKWYLAPKSFHVSPFYDRDGYYAFNFKIEDDKLRITIKLLDKDKKCTLLTSVTGELSTMNSPNALRALLTCPLLTFKVMTMIHWQALKLFLKKGLKVARPIKNAISAAPKIKI